MSINQFINKNKQFWWYVKNPLKLDENSIVEGTVKYGDMKEIRQLVHILGAPKIARIFSSQIKAKRVNYDAKTINYFQKYFKRYAK